MGNKVFYGMASGHESIQLPDTQVPDAELAIEASADWPDVTAPLEDERQAILTLSLIHI